ncbi:hypothetical protein [Corynebacterium uterequi]|uniref:SCP domain-containing protein n=1 Tax=Corynebacterium uterequi TaxID=1072256 RepID=A0A0G3HHM2_9CORY|nr:hypothetical protein [Corynebacterium uterequi]AKK11438.1 hypothetical protein CUTER_07245 [Corynebacterium uterequi]
MDLPSRRAQAPLLVAAALMISTLSAGIAHAIPDPTTHVELNASEENTVRGKASFNFADGRTVGIPALRELRRYAWQENLPFNGTSIREAAAAHGLTTMEAYANAPQSDGGLVRIAVQRAFEEPGSVAEASLRDHSRPTSAAACSIPGSEFDHTVAHCQRFSSATYNGHSSFSENLAWGADTLTEAIINQWGKAEVAALKQSNGGWNSATGHLHTLLNPEYIYYGFSAVDTERGEYGTSYSTQASPQRIDADNLPDKRQTVYLHRSVTSGETPTGAHSPEPATADPSLFSQMSSVFKSVFLRRDA